MACARVRLSSRRAHCRLMPAIPNLSHSVPASAPIDPLAGLFSCLFQYTLDRSSMAFGACTRHRYNAVAARSNGGQRWQKSFQQPRLASPQHRGREEDDDEDESPGQRRNLQQAPAKLVLHAIPTCSGLPATLYWLRRVLSVG
jgi:hypothetical protein